MTESRVGLSSKEQQIAALHVVRDRMQEFLDEAGVDREEGKLHIDEDKLVILSQRRVERPIPSYTAETFFFEGGIVVDRASSLGHLLADAGVNKLAYIQHIRVPTSFRTARAHLGSRIVTAWENAWTEFTEIDTFVAKGVLKDAQPFWEGVGYTHAPVQRFDMLVMPSSSSPHMYKKSLPRNS